MGLGLGTDCIPGQVGVHCASKPVGYWAFELCVNQNATQVITHPDPRTRTLTLAQTPTTTRTRTAIPSRALTFTFTFTRTRTPTVTLPLTHPSPIPTAQYPYRAHGGAPPRQHQERKGCVRANSRRTLTVRVSLVHPNPTASLVHSKPMANLVYPKPNQAREPRLIRADRARWRRRWQWWW